MSTFDDPNRQAVGLDPIWSGAGEEPPPPEGDPEPEPDPEPEQAAKRPSRRTA